MIDGIIISPEGYLRPGGMEGQHTAIEVGDNEPSKTPARDERRSARSSLERYSTEGSLP